MTSPSQPFPKEAIEAAAWAIKSSYEQCSKACPLIGFMPCACEINALTALTAAAPFFAAERDEARAEIERYKTPCATPEGFENILDASGAFKEIRKLKAEIKWTYDSNEAVLKSLAEARAERDAAIEAEREAGAKIADEHAEPNRFKPSEQWKQDQTVAEVYETGMIDASVWIASAIRARSIVAKNEEGKL